MRSGLEQVASRVPRALDHAPSMSAAVPARPHSEPPTPGVPAAPPQGVPGFPVCTPSLSLSAPPGPLIGALAAAVPAPQPGAPLVTRMTTMAGGAQQPKVTNSPRMPAPQTLSAKVPPTFQLPANFQIPPGTVLIRSNNGQLMLVSQQALARAQAQFQSSPSPRLVGTAEAPKNVGNNLLTKVSSPSSTSPGNSVSSTVQRTSVAQSTGPVVNVTVSTSRPSATTATTPGTPVSIGTTVTTAATTPSPANAGPPVAAAAPVTFGIPANSRIPSALGTPLTTLPSVTVGMPNVTQTSVNGMPSTTQTSRSVMPTPTSVCTPPTTRTPLTVGMSPFTRTQSEPLVTRTLETVATLPITRTPVTGDPPSITEAPLNVATPTSAQITVMTGAHVTVVPAVTQFSPTSTTTATILTSTVTSDTPNPTRMSITVGTPIATGTSSTVGTFTTVGKTDPPSIPTTVPTPDSVGSPTIFAVPVSLGSTANVGVSTSLVTPAMGGNTSFIGTPAVQGVPASHSTSATAGLPASVGTFATVGIPTTFGVSTTVRMPLPLCTTAMVRMPVPLGTTATVRLPGPLAAPALLRAPAVLSTTSKVLAPAPLGITAVVQSPAPLCAPATLAAVRTTASLCTSPAVRVPAPLGIPAAIRLPAPLCNSTTIGIPASLGTPAANLTPVTVCATPAAGRPLTVGMPTAIQIPATFGMSAGTRMSFTISTPTSSGTPLTIGLSGAVRTPAPLANSTSVGKAAHSFIPTTVSMPTTICLPVAVGNPGVTRMPVTGITAAHPGTPVIGSTPSANMNPTRFAAPATQKVVSIKTEAPNATPAVQTSNSSEMLDNVKKCKNFLATLIKLASSGPQAPEMGKNVKTLVQQLLETKIEPEEFTKRLYTELKSSPQPYLVPFLKKSLPALRQLMPNSHDFIQQCGQNQPAAPTTSINQAPVAKTAVVSSVQPMKTVCGTGPLTFKLQQPTSILKQPTTSTSQAVTVKQLIVQQPSGGILKHVTAIPQTTTQIVQKPAESKVPVNTLVQPRPFPPGSILKQITLPGNKILSLQAPPPLKNNIKENGMTSFRDEDDINDVTSMAGVNLNEENACILATNSELVGRLIRSSKEEPFLSIGPLQAKILELGKRHDVLELTSDAVSLISHATQERLRGLVEKLTIAAQHRAATYKGSDKYIQYSDTRSQLKFLEQLDHLEKRRKNEEEREMLLRAAKSRSNKEDPEQLRLKQKAKEMQQMELAQMQQREANLTALAAIGPRRKRPLDFGLSSRFEGSNGSTNSSSSTPAGLGKQLLRPRTTRVCLRDLIFCMEQEREMKYSLALYRAHLK